jgi:hypothetical protein
MGIAGYLRATIGTDAENDTLLEVSSRLRSVGARGFLERSLVERSLVEQGEI